jgi:hypothetical protein
VVSFQIFQNEKWVPFSLEATKEAVGSILKNVLQQIY